MNSNRTAGWLGLVVVLMVSLSFAAVPFYSWFCKVTGFGGTTSVAVRAPETLTDKMITVRFDANVEPGMKWQFKPEVTTMQLRIGETGLAFYDAFNPTDHAIAGQASYNVTPDAAGGYFTKIACFCFNEQVLQPGERIKMPVTFFVDPAILQNSEGKLVHEITLSYTFYEIPLSQTQAALAAPAAQQVN
ncbi:MAG: cytochrome c oxidase assembly protein [Alphaproteobacteria bacterium]|jgi:cytochrome c oxidase assembly protein subunit 11